MCFSRPGIGSLDRLSLKLSIGSTIPRPPLVGAPFLCYDSSMSTPELPSGNKSLISEFWDFIVHEKVWWMTPIVVVLLAMVGFILFAEASPVLPFIYAL
jgi:hypothetical protein